ncbi:MAG: DUF4426 domain-containing protein [Natronospirillum sp.]
MRHAHSPPSLALTLLLCLLLLPLSALSMDRTQTFGQWDAHFMVLPTSMLTPEVAARYGLSRSNNTAFANIAIMDNQAATLTGVPSTITGTFTNLVGQKRELEFQQVVEGDAVYYIAAFRFPHRERLRFQIDFTPEPDNRQYRLEFAQDIYREDRP